MKRCALALLGVLTVGCTNVMSLAAAVTPASGVTDDRLLGEWISDDDQRDRVRVIVTRGESPAYSITFTDGRDSSSAVGCLMPVGDRWLLDLWPSGSSMKAINDHNGIAVHWPVILETSEDSIRISVLDADTLRAIARKSGVPPLPMVVAPGGDVLLTDTTTQLATSLSRYLARPGVTRRVMTLRPASPRAPLTKGMVYGGVIGGVIGAVVGAAVIDPDAPGWFSGREWGAVGGGLAGAIAGMIVGGIAEALRQ